MTDTNAPERFTMDAVTDGERAWCVADPHPDGEWVRFADLATHAPREDGYSAGVRAAAAERANRRATFDAMCAMRNDINEHIPMPSLESDLLQGPEDSVFCAAVAEAVIAALVRLHQELTDARAGAVEPVAWKTATQFDGRTSNSLDPVEVTWNVEELKIAAHQLHRGVTFSAFARRQFAEAVLGYIAVSAPPPTPACTATDGPASACVYRAPGLGTAATFEKG